MTTTIARDRLRAARLPDELGEWVPAHERVPAPGTECVVRVIWPRHWYTAHGETMRMFA